MVALNCVGWWSSLTVGGWRYSDRSHWPTVSDEFTRIVNHSDSHSVANYRDKSLKPVIFVVWKYRGFLWKFIFTQFSMSSYFIARSFSIFPIKILKFNRFYKQFHFFFFLWWNISFHRAPNLFSARRRNFL